VTFTKSQEGDVSTVDGSIWRRGRPTAPISPSFGAVRRGSPRAYTQGTGWTFQFELVQYPHTARYLPEGIHMCEIAARDSARHQNLLGGRAIAHIFTAKPILNCFV
jgi:hypothetical protein